MEKLPPPLLGFNNNVRHQGRMFHIQTEDSGVKHARIVTHLFADGGRILRTTRTDYTDKLGHKDMPEVLRRLMKQQHKAMFIALRAGELDAAIGAALGSESPEPGGSGNPQAAVSMAPQSVPQARPSPEDTIPIVTKKPASDPGSSSAPKGKPPPPVRSGSREKANRAKRGCDGVRPASLFELPTPGVTIFNEGVLSERSLDDTILSYLDEEEEDVATDE